MNIMELLGQQEQICQINWSSGGVGIQTAGLYQDLVEVNKSKQVEEYDGSSWTAANDMKFRTGQHLGTQTDAKILQNILQLELIEFQKIMMEPFDCTGPSIMSSA